MFKFGNIEVKGKVFLAPMAGITIHGYRKFMSSFGVDVAYSEMVSDMGLIYENKETNSYVVFPKENVPVGIQLFGHDPLCLAKAASICEKLNDHFDFFDINMGCPVPKVTNTGAGSSLLKDPKIAGDIIRKIKEITNKPVTAKIRLGWDNHSINFLEVINELENAGADLIAIHARTKKDLYMGEPRWDLLKDLRKKVNVPLVVSGNIFTLDDAIQAMDITGADAVMVARGGMGNPYLIKQINHYYETGERLANPSITEQIKYCYELGVEYANDLGEDIGMRMYRAVAPKFFTGFPNSKNVRKKLVTELVNLDSLKNILDEFKSSIN